MSPEQREGRVVETRADQYSFCVALSEALRNRGAPEALLAVARRGLAHNPAARFATMDELLAALQAASLANRRSRATRDRMALGRCVSRFDCGDRMDRNRIREFERGGSERNVCG